MNANPLAATMLTFALVSAALGQGAGPPRAEPYRLAQQYACGEKYCKAMRDCREAVFHWACCGEADRDGDGRGVPCENVCGDESARTLDLVRELRQELGC